MEANGNSIPTNGVVQSLLTDLYQVTMAYSYWKNGQQNCHAVFDVFFRKNPFDGEFTIFAGLGEVLKLLRNLKYSESDIDYLKTILPANAEQEFFDYLSAADGKGIKLYSVEEGTVVFPREPLIRVEGPLPLVQLLETTILNLVNYASLVATNAARFRIAAGEDKKLLEFGLRRAQGPDGGLSASKYCYIGGFDGTSNVLAGKLFGIPVSGTHAHSYVMAHTGVSQLASKELSPKDRPSEAVDFLTLCQKWKERVCQACRVSLGQTNDGELASYISYSMAFPNGFLALLDTYDILRSGLPNFCTVALALHELGYKAMGVRIDSGDLAYLSNEIRKVFHLISREFNVPWFADLTIVASNDIDEETLLSLNQQGHSIDAYGIGTHLVTCRKQPSLGVVFKLVQVDELARIKLSQDVAKVTIPGQKTLCRLYGKDGHALLDLMLREEEKIPEKDQRVLCRHPFEESKRANVIPARVEVLQKLCFENGKICCNIPKLKEIKERVQVSLKSLRNDHKRALNPTPYKEAWYCKGAAGRPATGYLEEHLCYIRKKKIAMVKDSPGASSPPTPLTKVSTPPKLRDKKKTLAFFLLPVILRGKGKGKKGLCSVKEAITSFVDIQPEVADILQISKAIDATKKPQPFVVCKGTLLAPTQTFVILERRPVPHF